MAIIKIREESCKSCGYCVKFCPRKVISIGTGLNSKGYSFAYASAPEACIGCALCAAICPDAAIEVFREETTV